MLGNTKLMNYGIFDESPDTIRIHVGVTTGLVFVFKSGDAQALLRRLNYGEKPAYTDGIVTGWGATPAWDDIPNIRSHSIPQDLLDYAKRYERANPSEKGGTAVHTVKNMLGRGLIPINIQITEVNDAAEQIRGIDATAKMDISIQVKMDWKAGPKERGGTGNLFLQTRECNPFKYH